MLIRREIVSPLADAASTVAQTWKDMSGFERWKPNPVELEQWGQEATQLARSMSWVLSKPKCGYRMHPGEGGFDFPTATCPTGQGHSDNGALETGSSD